MSAPSGEPATPAGAVCAVHADARATFLCARCGDYACEACARRVTPTASPLCAGCWGQREHVAGELRRGEGAFRTWVFVAVAALLVAWLALVATTFLGGL